MVVVEGRVLVGEKGEGVVIGSEMEDGGVVGLRVVRLFRYLL